MKHVLSIHHPIFKIFILASSIFILYSFILSAPFKTLDDQASIYADPDIRDINHIARVFTRSFFGNDGFYYRPLVSFSFALEHHFFGFVSFFFNLTNIILYCVATVIIFCFVSFVFGDQRLGFWVSWLFAIHPVNVEAVANIAGRSILLCALFEWISLLSFAFFLKSRRRILFFFSLASFALALLSKESSAPLALTIGVYAFLFSERSAQRLRRSCMLALPFFLVLAGYFFVRSALKISSVSFVINLQDYFYGILTFARSGLTYARILLWPVDLHFDRIRPVIDQLLGFESMMTIVVWLTIFGLLWKFYRRLSPAMLFFIALIFIRFLPLSQIIPIRSQAGYICVPDHFLYVPSVGFLVCLVLCFRWLTGKLIAMKQITPFWVHSLVALWILFLCCITIEQNIYATNETALFRRSVSFTPEHVRMNVALGLNYVARHQFKEAEPYFRRALEREPFNTRARVSLATVLLDQGKLWEGLQEYEQIPDAKDFQDLVEKNKKLAYQLLIKKYSAMIKDKDAPADVYYSLGVVYAKKEDFKQAIPYFQKALQQDPKHANALRNLCNSLRAAGNEREAQSCFKRIGEP